MKDRMTRKLKSRSGESIAETLVAVLIAAFGLLMLAGTINSASNLITNSKKKLSEYYEANNTLASATSTSGTDGSVSINEATGETAWITSKVKVFKNDKLGSRTVVAYRK